MHQLKYCMKAYNKNQYLCRSVAFIVSMGLFSLIVGLSLYGFFKLSDIMKGLSGMSCTVFKLYLEILNGQSVEKLPKWTGVNGIINTLNDVDIFLAVELKNKIAYSFYNKLGFQLKEHKFKDRDRDYTHNRVYPKGCKGNVYGF